MIKKILKSTLLSCSLLAMMYCCTAFINTHTSHIEPTASVEEMSTDDGLVLLARNKGTQTSDANIDKPKPTKKKPKKKR